jgi:hydrogenase maturation factor
MCLGIPAQIKEIIDIDNQIAMVDLSGVSRAVNIACVLFSKFSVLLFRQLYSGQSRHAPKPID